MENFTQVQFVLSDRVMYEYIAGFFISWYLCNVYTVHDRVVNITPCKAGSGSKKSFCIYNTGFKGKSGLFVMGHLGGSASTLNISKTLIYIWDGFKP
jgi:hypothetical protein